MRERLREVPDQAPGVDVVLLGEQAEVVAEREQPLEERLRLGEAALEHHHLDEPERARQERPLAGREPVDAGVLLVGAVPLDEPVAHEVPLDRRDRARDARVVDGEEADEGHQQQARVEPRRAVELGERAELLVESLPADLVVDLVAELAPALDRPVAPVLLDAPHGAVERDPRHHLRVREVTARAAHLPDPLVGLAPAVLEPLEQLPRAAPMRPRDALEPRAAARGRGRRATSP